MSCALENVIVVAERAYFVPAKRVKTYMAI